MNAPPGSRRHEAQAADSDHEARIEVLHRRFRHRLIGFLRANGAHPPSCDDLVQDTFTVAWTRPASLPADDNEARLWLFAVARRLLANDRRARARRQDLADQVARGKLGTAAGAGLAPDPAVRGEALDAWRALSDEEQALLRARGWDGLDNAALAQGLGCSISATENRLSRARERLGRTFL